MGIKKSFNKLKNTFNSSNLKGRSLTLNEITIAKSVYGDEIDYHKVKVFFRPYFYLGPNNVSMAPNGHIYFLPQYSKLSDMGHDSASRQLLIHELAHVWQHQKGVNVKQEAIKLFFQNNLNYSNAYKYNLSDNISFDKLNIEQQATVLQHGFALKEKYNSEFNKTKSGYDLSDIKRKINTYNKIIKPHLPFS